MKIKVGPYLFSCSNDLEKARVESLFEKEEGTIAWLKSALPGDVLYDVGANIGLYTVVFGCHANAGRVYAFEPHVANAASLLRNVKLNNCQGRTRLITSPLHSKPGWLDFNYISETAGASGSQLGHKTAESGQQFTPSAIELKYATSIDALWATNAIGLASMVKIDVDGNELEILKGMRRLLDQWPPRSIQVEVHPKDAVDILALMRQNGFEIESRHFTANGKKELLAGKAPEVIVHNVIFHKA